MRTLKRLTGPRINSITQSNNLHTSGTRNIRLLSRHTLNLSKLLTCSLPSNILPIRTLLRITTFHTSVLLLHVGHGKVRVDAISYIVFTVGHFFGRFYSVFLLTLKPKRKHNPLPRTADCRPGPEDALTSHQIPCHAFLRTVDTVAFRTFTSTV